MRASRRESASACGWWVCSRGWRGKKKKGFRAKNGPWDSIQVARGVAGGAGGVVGVPPGVVVALVGVVGGGEGADSACSGWGGVLTGFRRERSTIDTVGQRRGFQPARLAPAYPTRIVSGSWCE